MAYPFAYFLLALSLYLFLAIRERLEFSRYGWFDPKDQYRQLMLYSLVWPFVIFLFLKTLLDEFVVPRYQRFSSWASGK